MNHRQAIALAAYKHINEGARMVDVCELYKVTAREVDDLLIQWDSENQQDEDQAQYDY